MPKTSGFCVWNDSISVQFPGFERAKNGKRDHCFCTHCNKDISIHHKGKKDIEKHISTNEHSKNVSKSVKTKPLTVHFNGLYYKKIFIEKNSE